MWCPHTSRLLCWLLLTGKFSISRVRRGQIRPESAEPSPADFLENVPWQVADLVVKVSSQEGIENLIPLLALALVAFRKRSWVLCESHRY